MNVMHRSKKEAVHLAPTLKWYAIKNVKFDKAVVFTNDVFVITNFRAIETVNELLISVHQRTVVTLTLALHCSYSACSCSLIFDLIGTS